MAYQYKSVWGLACIIVGALVVLWAMGEFIIRIIVALAALSLINYGLRLCNMPPLQLLFPIIFTQRWF